VNNKDLHKDLDKAFTLMAVLKMKLITGSNFNEACKLRDIMDLLRPHLPEKQEGIPLDEL